jgi:hypothetical protein
MVKLGKHPDDSHWFKQGRIWEALDLNPKNGCKVDIGTCHWNTETLAVEEYKKKPLTQII